MKPLSILFLALFSCIAHSFASGHITLIDAKGRNVTIPQPIQRYALGTIDLVDYIVPLMGEQAFSMLVGTGDSGSQAAYEKIYYDLPLPQKKQQNKMPTLISDHGSPFDIEALIALKPDILILNADQGYELAMQSEAVLKQVGIPMLFIDIPGTNYSVDTSVQAAFRLLGEAFNRQEKAFEVIGFINQQFEKVRLIRNSIQTPRPAVYYEFFGNKETIGTTQGSKNGWGAIIDYAGGHNIVDALINGLQTGNEMVLDPEFLFENNPDFIITTGTNHMGLTSGPELQQTADFSILQRTGWDQIQAVKRRNIYEIMFGLNRSPFSFYAVQRLAKTFYPQQFKLLEPEQNLAQYFETFTLLNDDHSMWFMRVEQ